MNRMLRGLLKKNGDKNFENILFRNKSIFCGYLMPLLSGFLAVFFFGASASEVKIHHRTDFEQIRSEIRAEVLKQFERIYGEDCSTQATSKQSPSGYRCGEVPLGDILNENEKKLFSFGIERGKIKDLNRGAVNLSRDAQFDLILRRSFEGGNTNISLIENKREEAVRIIGRMDRNVFIRTSPHGQVLWTHACLYLPQMRIQVPRQTLHFDGHQKKRILFKSIKGKFTATADVTAGQMIVQEARVCSVYRTTMEGPSVDRLRPKTELVRMGLPEVLRLQTTGLQVTNTRAKLSGRLASIFSSILRTVGIADIPRMIQREVQSAVQSEVNRQLRVTEGEIRSGEWMRKTFVSMFSESVVTRDTARAFREATQKAMVDARRVPTTFGDDCSRALSARGMNLNTNLLNQFCGNLVREVKLTPFARWKRYIDRGCYDHKFSVFLYPNQPANQTWNRECAIMSTVTVSGHQNSERSRRCLANQWRNNASRAQMQSSCRDHLVADFLNLRSINHAQQIRTADNPQQVLTRLNYTPAEIRQIGQRLQR